MSNYKILEGTNQIVRKAVGECGIERLFPSDSILDYLEEQDQLIEKLQAKIKELLEEVEK